MNLDVNCHQDQLVCLSCGQRANHRHNLPCTRCSVMMVYERAWANLERVAALFSAAITVNADEVAQLALF